MWKGRPARHVQATPRGLIAQQQNLSGEVLKARHPDERGRPDRGD